jgi:hypothetical protein
MPYVGHGDNMKVSVDRPIVYGQELNHVWRVIERSVRVAGWNEYGITFRQCNFMGSQGNTERAF